MKLFTSISKIGSGVKTFYGIATACVGLTVAGWVGRGVVQSFNEKQEVQFNRIYAKIDSVGLDAMKEAQHNKDRDSIMLCQIKKNTAVVDKLAQKEVNIIIQDTTLSNVEVLEKLDGFYQYLDDIKKNEKPIMSKPNGYAYTTNPGQAKQSLSP